MENFIKTISLSFLQTVIFNELYFVDIDVEKNTSTLAKGRLLTKYINVDHHCKNSAQIYVNKKKS